MNPEIPSLILAQEGSVSGHSNIQLVKSELFLLSVVMGKATVVPLTSLESLWISSDVSRGWFDLIILNAHICNSPTLSQHSEAVSADVFIYPKVFAESVFEELVTVSRCCPTALAEVPPKDGRDTTGQGEERCCGNCKFPRPWLWLVAVRAAPAALTQIMTWLIVRKVLSY